MIQILADALSERGYDTLTPVQEAVTDPALAEADLLVSAQTGSGKTVGFGLAIGPTLLDAEGALPPAAAPLALVVAPTRELAFQVMRELAWLYAKAGARMASCVGGMDMRDERRTLERGAHIVVGTPGRLRDHIARGSLDLADLRAVVLDEADEMLDLGFREDLEFMLGEAPEDRRTLMFSATVPPAIAALAQHYQRDAVRVTTVSDRGQHADIAYQALRVAPQDAETAIVNVLRYHEAQTAIVFANTRATVNRLTARFANRGFSVVCLSGELSQTERSHALQALRDGRARVCIATDVAARGIDLPNLELVVHAELPSNTEGLLHRSGRTGRAGRKGLSALIVPPKALRRAERLLREAGVTADWLEAPSAEEILRRDEERLLSDPAWEEPVTENAAAFAQKLLARHAPEAVAAAYLRLYRAGHSAPEELSSPEARPAPRERAPFGPSAWVALSVGRSERAEPRWLLPLLCRAGGLEREAIGAIRVQDAETFVELTEAAVPDLMARLDAGGALEKGVTVRALDGAPDLGPERAAPRRGPRPDRPRPERPRAERRAAAPGAEAAAAGASAGAETAPAPDVPRAGPIEGGTRPEPRSERGHRDARPSHKDRESGGGGRPFGKDRAESPSSTDRDGGRPAGGDRGGARSFGQERGARPSPTDRNGGGSGGRDRDGGRSFAKDRNARAAAADRGAAPGGAPRSEGKAAGRAPRAAGDSERPRHARASGPEGKARDAARPAYGSKAPGGKPGGKPGHAGKGPGGKPAFGGKPGGPGKPGFSKGPRGPGGPGAKPERANASDTSKRFTPPGRPGGKGPSKGPVKGPRAGFGGTQPPKRRKP